MNSNQQSSPGLSDNPEFTALFAINQRLSDALRNFLSKTHVRIPEKGLSPPQAVVLVALAKGLKTYCAITILCGEGYGEDAVILLRSLFEHALEVRYAAQGPDAAQRWLDYDWVFRYELDKVVRTDPYFRELPELVKAYDEMTNEIQEGARRAQDRWRFWQKDERGKLSRPQNWSGMSIRVLAKKVGWESHYNTFYRLASLRVHPNVCSANDYVELLEGRGIRLNIAPTARLVVKVLLSAHIFLATIADHWCELMEPPQEIRDELQAIGQDFEELIRKRLGPEGVARASRASENRTI